MRGSDRRSGLLFSYVDLEDRVRADHPLRTILQIANAALDALGAEFEAIYATGVGRPWIPPERLLRALLLQAFYGVRSERQIMERREYDLLFRWFVGLGVKTTEASIRRFFRRHTISLKKNSARRRARPA